MTEQANPQPTVRTLSRPEQQQRFPLARQYRRGLLVLTVVGGFLVITLLVAFMPVANAMSQREQKINQNGAGRIEVVAQQPVKPTPTPTHTSTPVPTPTHTPTAEPVQPLAIDPNSVPAVVWPNTAFTLRGTANPGARVRIIQNPPNYPNPDVEQIRGHVFADASGQWAFSIQFDRVVRYWVQAQLIVDYDMVIASSAKLSIEVSEPPPTNTPTPATQSAPTDTPTPAGGV